MYILEKKYIIYNKIIMLWQKQIPLNVYDVIVN